MILRKPQTIAHCVNRLNYKFDLACKQVKEGMNTLIEIPKYPKTQIPNEIPNSKSQITRSLSFPIKWTVRHSSGTWVFG